MKHFVVILGMLAMSLGCSSEQPPLDANGMSPEDVMMETYSQILDGQLDQAQTKFSPDYVEEFMTSKGVSFREYCEMTSGWRVEWLKTKLVGNDYNDSVWRVKIIPDEGKGEHNRPGIVQDLRIIDGEWKIVFWAHYPKS